MGPYQELAWKLKFELKPEINEANQKPFLEAMASFADANQLGLFGQLGDLTVVSLANRKAVSLDEQQLLKSWLSNRPEIALVLEKDGDGYTDAYLQQLLCWGEWETDSFTKFFS